MLMSARGDADGLEYARRRRGIVVPRTAICAGPLMKECARAVVPRGLRRDQGFGGVDERQRLVDRPLLGHGRLGDKRKRHRHRQPRRRYRRSRWDRPARRQRGLAEPAAFQSNEVRALGPSRARAKPPSWRSSPERTVVAGLGWTCRLIGPHGTACKPSATSRVVCSFDSSET